MIDQPTLQLVAGTGIVARRAAELLFLPTGSPDLLDVFGASEPGGSLEAVTDFCEAEDFAVAEFVVLNWTSGLTAAVFGDVELTSNQKSLPRLSGAGAGTWVERSLRRIDGPIEIGVAIADRIESTDLVEGRAQAGGFALCLSALPTAAPVVAPPAPFHRADEVSEPEVPDAQVDREMTQKQALVSPTKVPPAEPSDMSDSDRSQPDTRRRTLPLEPMPEAPVEAPIAEDGGAAEAGKVADDLLGALTGDSRGVNPYEVGPDDDTVVPTPEMRAVVDSLVADGSPESGRSDADRPRWQLRIVDGDIEVVDRDLILGRKPELTDTDGPGDARLIPLNGTHLSRSHLRVCLRDGAVYLVDLASTNGSFMFTTGDDQLVQLEPHVERRVDAGTIVQTGSVRFFVEAGTGT